MDQKSISLQLKNIKKVNRDQDELISLLFKSIAGFESNIKIIYFEDSTEENPAKIHGGQTYNVLNPFPGKTIMGRAEIFFDNEWIECPKIQVISKSDDTIDVVTPEEIVQSLSEVKARLKVWAVDMIGINVAFVDNALIGEIRFSLSKEVTPGWLPLTGNTYSREQYSALWQWANSQDMVIAEDVWQNLYAANNGNVVRFSSGDESTTFRLPSINAWAKGTNNVDEVGSYLKEGLPNIMGDITFYPNSMNNESGNLSGAFSVSEDETAHTTIGVLKGTTDTTRVLTLNASKYNGIYGNSTEVQPSSVVGLWLIKAYENTVYDANDRTIQDLQAVADKSFVKAEVVDGNLILTTNSGEEVTISGISGGGESSSGGTTATDEDIDSLFD